MTIPNFTIFAKQELLGLFTGYDNIALVEQPFKIAKKPKISAF
jgi:hypothetical protein